MSDGLLRQRRNMMALALILIFFKFAGVEIEKLTFLGVEFKSFKNTSAVYSAIWIFFWYYVFRYYQYFSQEGWEKLKAVYFEEMNSRVANYCYELTKAIHPSGSYVPFDQNLGKHKQLKIKVTYPEKKDDHGKVERLDKVIPLSRVKVFICRVRTFMKMFFNTSLITDYLIPFFLVLFAIFYCFNGSESSFLAVLNNTF